MIPVAFCRLARWSALVLVLGQVGCAARGEVSSVRMSPAAMRVEPGGEDCEAFSHEEAQIVRGDAPGTWLVDRENLSRRAVSRLSKADSQGYVRWRVDGPGDPRARTTEVFVDARVIPSVLMGLLITVELVAHRIQAAAESVERQSVAYDAAMRDCTKATAAAHVPPTDPLDLAQSLRRMGSRYHARGKPAEAERFYRRALAVQGQGLFATQTAVAEGLQALVRLYRARGHDADADRLQAWLREPLREAPQAPVLTAGP